MIYLDNAATTYPKPLSVQKRVNEAVRIYGGNPGRGGHQMSLAVSKQVFAVRERAARFFHAPVENVVFTSNCTHSLNTAIQGIMSGGGHVIISCMEHNSVYRPVYAMAKVGRITYDVAKVYEGDPQRTVQSFEHLIRRDTKAIVCTHASNVTGMVMPIRELGELCRKKGIYLIVDAAQTAGVLPIDMEAMGIHILCTAGHKGLYGTTGTGLLIFAPGVEMKPLLYGGTGSASSDPEQPVFLPDRFESGTVNSVGILSVGAGIQQIERMGLKRIYDHESAICSRIYRGLGSIKDAVTYIQKYEPGQFAPIVLFNLKGKTSTQVVTLLDQHGICVRGGLHCAPLAHEALGTLSSGAVRVSPSIFTTPSQAEQFLRVLKQIS